MTTKIGYMRIFSNTTKFAFTLGIFLIPMATMASIETGFATVEGGEIYYEVSGTGEPLIFIHGNAGDRRHWDHQFLPLAIKYKVVRYDVRGYGNSSLPETGQPYSDTRDLGRLMDHLEIEQAHIIGWSMGSGIAVDFSITHPNRVLSLISVGPWVNGYRSENATAMSRDMGQVVRQIRERGIEFGADEWMKAPFFVSTVSRDSSGEEFHEIARDYSWWSFLNSAQIDPITPPAIERLNSIELPTLILTAENDIPACLEVSELLETEINGAIRVVMDGTGHLLHMEKPLEFNAHIVEFIGGLP